MSICDKISETEDTITEIKIALLLLSHIKMPFHRQPFLVKWRRPILDKLLIKLLLQHINEF